MTGCLDGIRVVELADEQAEYCGLLLAGLGAEVIKVEPPGGSPTRRIGPFYRDRQELDTSLYFWQYNRGKQSIVLDGARDDDRRSFRRLLSGADILLLSAPSPQLAAMGLQRADLGEAYPSLIVALMSPFGDTGPWAEYRGSDLVHLALGGVMMNCGYDPEPSGRYDCPPIAPQMWHSYHVAGDQMAMGIVAALLYRHRTGQAQRVTCAIHEAVSKSTEIDLMSWVMLRWPVFRQTCRHAIYDISRVPTIAHTKDGRWVMMQIGMDARDEGRLVEFLRRWGMEADLTAQVVEVESNARNIPGTSLNSRDEHRYHVMEVAQRFIRAFTYGSVPWREAQDAGLLCSPLRKPHENAQDEHWVERGTYSEVVHPELGISIPYPTSKWISTAGGWSAGRRAPLLDEDRERILTDLRRDGSAARVAAVPPGVEPVSQRRSPRGKPFALDGTRILDFTWFLASAGGTRFLASMGAECIKVEWKGHPDTRIGAMAPVGGREARRLATSPLNGVTDSDMGGQFNLKNAGKRGISLNVRHPSGLAIAKKLVAISDIVAEGFSPGVMDRWGLGYEVQRAINPDIVYVQQSAAGSRGTYGRFRAIGPIAASLTGLSEMSGLPEPAMPAGWGYSYLDWIGAYSFALAMLVGLYHRERTGEGQWIDASQCEAGLFLNGVPVLDWFVNGREYSRVGNRSPHKPAAPHGAYPCLGVDRWLAIACFTEHDWQGLAGCAGHPEWLLDERFATLSARVSHLSELDSTVSSWTQTVDARQTMDLLQAAGIPAGVCQTAEDRCDRDPQLAALQWMTEVTGTKIGTWPLPELPVRMSETPPYVGGPLDRGAPCYGEDTEYVLGELLGMSSGAICALADDGVI